MGRAVGTSIGLGPADLDFELLPSTSSSGSGSGSGRAGTLRVQAPSSSSSSSSGRAARHRRRALLASVSSAAAAAGGAPAALLPVPAGVIEGPHRKQYAWDGRRLRALAPEDLAKGEHPGRTLQGALRRSLHDLQAAFFPNVKEVSPDYWEYLRWRGLHRVFSSMNSVFATQSLLQAVGVGARRSLPAAATINWVLKDGLGRLGRLTVATRFGESFDADLKRFRYTTSLLYAAALSLEFLTPRFPQHFLALASVANIGKSIGLTTFIATQPAFHRSFACHENLANISAKAQAQQMVMDNLGLAGAVALTHACRHSEAARRALPLIAFPLLAAGDLYSIYRELRSIHLRTLNRERAEIIAQQWLAEGRVPSPREVSMEERLVLPSHIAGGCLPLTVGALDHVVRSEADLQRLQRQGPRERYLLSCTPPCQPPPGDGIAGALARWVGGRRAGDARLALRSDAGSADVVQAVLQVAYLRQALGVPLSTASGSSNHGSAAGSGGGSSGRGPSSGSGKQHAAALDCCRDCQEADVGVALAESGKKAAASLAPFLSELGAAGWQVAPFMLSSTEKRTYVRL